jgi:hypothetical protein
MTDAHSPVAALPYVDEHRVRIQAPASAVWRALGASLPKGSGRMTTALLGTVPGRSVGDPLREGSAIPGFAVRAAVPERELALAGRHRFSDYSLAFALEEQDGATELRAISRARFPGLRGTLYRALVIGSGGHRVIMRRWLDRIRQQAERA